MNACYKIVDYLKHNGASKPSDLSNSLGFSRQTIQNCLRSLLNERKIEKIGSSPNVEYKIAKERTYPKKFNKLDKNKITCIENSFLYVSPRGDLNYGIDGFSRWTDNTNQTNSLDKLIDSYFKIRKEADSFLNDINLIEGKQRIINSKDDFLDSVYFSDFYSLIQFGKTKLGSLTLYSKQSGNKDLINEIARIINDSIQKLLNLKNIDSIAYIPPSIDRKVQFIKVFSNALRLPRAEIMIEKRYQGSVRVAQKTLKTAKERIENAQTTIFVNENYTNEIKNKNILILDDACASGATLNETAKKLKVLEARQVIGYAITGSYKGFEVIREV